PTKFAQEKNLWLMIARWKYLMNVEPNGQRYLGRYIFPFPFFLLHPFPPFSFNLFPFSSL
ncbi:hypothetical protein, partial [Belliella aquatica]|uniref:hypothetical protein n=1 Tax=Belliella aquatica TaxID=1323734 RepID=UPI001E607131